jgi:uncharacterized membrane protein (DUF485 family)
MVSDRTPDVEERLRALSRARLRVSVALTAAVVAAYFGFIGAVAFAPALLGRLIVPGLSVGIVFGASVIVAAWGLTWVYVRWANAVYDPALQRLREPRE